MNARIQSVLTFIGEQAKQMGRSFRARWRRLLFIFSWFVGLFILTIFAGMEVTSRSQFCGSCHIMEPYFNSWQHSSHKNIPCVDCHIPQGVTSGLAKKYEALSMVSSYFTGTYGTKPWAEVGDGSCLQCHERRLLVGKQTFENAHFNHTPHLTEMRGGEKLRCTTCHAQTEQGSHISVSKATCFLCHFKGQQLNEGTGRCTLCHDVPDKVMTKANLSFDHANVKRFNMQCFSCHSQIIQGQGEVPRERCNTCHNDLSKIQRIGETQLLHHKHVTEHKVECTDCHMEIQHKSTPAQPVQSLTCGSCHRDSHSAANDLYSGVGGKGVPPMPSVMFTAGVSCGGCHVLPTNQGRSKVLKANDVSCMACHGPRYNKMLDRWKTLIGERLSQIKAVYAQARQSGSAHPEAGPLADAWANIQLVEQGVGTHNVEYALALIEASHDLINQARQQANLAPLAKSWSSPAYESSCFRCHRGIELQSGKFFNLSFFHKPHVNAGFECATCHRPHEEKAEGEVVRFGQEGCANCHHQQQQLNPSYCTSCHAVVFKKKVPFKSKLFDHSFHVKDLSQKCSDCHLARGAIRRSPNLNFCSTCHPDGFQN